MVTLMVMGQIKLGLLKSLMKIIEKLVTVFLILNASTQMPIALEIKKMS